MSEVPGYRPMSPLITLGPVLVTVVWASTAKVSAVPSGAAEAPDANTAATSSATIIRPVTRSASAQTLRPDGSSAPPRRANSIDHPELLTA